jgi:hypothetical protein
MRLPAQPFKGGPGHVDPAEAAEPAVLPNHHRAEGSLDIDANPMQERWPTPHLRMSASRRNRASRRGGQRLTRARGSACESACPHLRAPGASVPDGGAIRRKLVTRSRVFGAGSLIPVTNAIEALNAKLRRARAHTRAFSHRSGGNQIAVSRLAPGRADRENAAARMVRS